jgi:hexosaminidase
MMNVEISYRECAAGLAVSLKEGKAVISAARTCDRMRAEGILRQWLAEGQQEGNITEVPAFAHLSYMIDCSRNAVPSVAYIKKLVDFMAFLGYDRLLLYTEDTYEIEGRPYWGWMRGRYSRDEIREIDAYASEKGIELVPCIQTLAHLGTIFRWSDFSDLRDVADILNTASEDTYELIEDMVRTFAETVHSRVIHLGMDESELVGRGKYINRNGYRDSLEIIVEHFNRVRAICEKYGFTCMVWSDMFLKLLSGGSYDGEFTAPADIRDKIPQDVELIYWDYYARRPEKYDLMFDRHKVLTDNTGFAGGAWKWRGFAPLQTHSLISGRCALASCRKKGIQNVILTGWGDDGGEGSQDTVLPILTLYAEENYEGRGDDTWLERRMRAGCGGEFRDFINLELPNMTSDNPCPGRLGANPAKYLFYSDPLLGFYDCYEDTENDEGHFRHCAEIFAEAAERNHDYEKVFHTMEALSRVLELKADLSVKFRRAYDAQNLQALAMLADQSEAAAERVRIFKDCLYRQWISENKIFGWEVLDIRIAGVAARLESAAGRVRAYVNGEIEQLDELVETRLPLSKTTNDDGKLMAIEAPEYQKIVTACPL